MTVITTLEAQGRIKATNPFPSGEGGDFSLLEIQHKHLILHPNKIQTALHGSVRTGIQLDYDEMGRFTLIPSCKLEISCLLNVKDIKY